MKKIFKKTPALSLRLRVGGKGLVRLLFSPCSVGVRLPFGGCSVRVFCSDQP
jgi:hypothetical protein